MEYEFGRVPQRDWEHLPGVFDLSFRSYDHEIILLIGDYKNMEIAANAGFSYGPGDNALLTYGYIDHEAGLTFEVLSFMQVGGPHMIYREGNPEITFKIRAGSINGKVSPLQSALSAPAVLKSIDKIQAINDGYKASAVIEQFRKMKMLDASRDKCYPDDVLVIFHREGLRPEGIWCRVNDCSDQYLIAKVLNEPYGDYGIHAGDPVELDYTMVDRQIKIIAALR